MPYFENTKRRFNAVKRKFCPDSAKNFVTLQWEMEQLLDLDHDELLLRDINDLRADFDFWLEDEAGSDGLFQAEVNRGNLNAMRVDGRRTIDLLNASTNRILVRPNVVEFLDDLETLEQRLQDASASYSYSSS